MFLTSEKNKNDKSSLFPRSPDLRNDTGTAISPISGQQNKATHAHTHTLTRFIPKLLLRCGLLAWTRFRLILRKAGALSGL